MPTQHLLQPCLRRIAPRLGLAFCAAFGPFINSAAAPSQVPRVSFTSFGNVHIGMSREQVERALAVELRSQEPHTGADGCEYVRPQPGSNHVGFMFLQHHLARINVSDPAVLTTSGAHVGSSKASILRIYAGRVDTSPHDYTAPEGEY